MRKSNYGFCEYIRNIIYVIKTKLFYSSCRLIRFPIIIRGRKYIDFGTGLTVGYYCRFEVNGIHKKKRLIFGKNVNMGDSVRISCVDSIKIGDNVLIGSKVLIIDNSHGKYYGENEDDPYTAPNKRRLVSKKISIGDNVWIGEGVSILMGVRIGSGTIVGANSVVTKSFGENCIIAGNPATILKKYNDLDGKWW